MKIAVLGSNGFVGSSLAMYLNRKFDVHSVNRKTLDLLSHSDVKKFLQNEKFDVILNCAAVMTQNDSLHDTRNNLSLFMSFFNNSSLFGKFINLGSAAEYDRSENIENVKEEEIFQRIPKDSYGYGQNIKTRLCYEKENFFGLKIFNCFGSGEASTRTFPRLINQPIFKVNPNRYFDFFSIQDLCKVVEYSLKNDLKYKDINCVYSEKYTVEQIANKFVFLNNLNCEVEVASFSDINYTGDSTKLSSLKLDLLGLDDSFEKYFDSRKS